MVVLRLVAMGVEVPGCCAHLGHESGVDSRRGITEPPRRQERGAGLRPLSWRGSVRPPTTTVPATFALIGASDRTLIE